MKVFDENRHIFLLQQKMQQDKQKNEQLGMEKKNLRFETEEDNEEWASLERLGSRQKLRYQVQRMLLREFHDFRQSARNKKYDPMDLKNIIIFLNNKYI